MQYFAARISWMFQQWPTRFRRLGRHLAGICPWRLAWYLDLCFYVSGLLFIFDIYELSSNLLSRRIRPLTAREYDLLYAVFADTLPYQLIRIDEQARLGPPQYRFCYVSFLTINSWGPMSPVTLVHEAVHIWQYVGVGAVYIPRALRAQRTDMGYNYGGLKKLATYPDMEFYNYEQQADIIADAYALQQGYQPRWSPGACPENITVFMPFLNFVRTSLLGK